MKKYSLFLLILITFLAACAPQRVITPTPKHTSTNTPPPTASPQPTQTLEPISTLEPTRALVGIVERIPFNFSSCSSIIRTTIGSTGFLQVIYAQSEGIFIELPEGFAGLVNNDYRRQLWLWSEDAQKAAPILQPPDALGARVSADLHWIVFRRDIEKTKRSELWVVDTNGNNERRLAAISYDEVKKRNPNEDSEVAFLGYGWVPNTNKVYYSVELGGIYDTFALVDIHSGQQIQLVEPGTVLNLAFAPDGSQVAILTANKPPQVNAGNYSSQPAVLQNFGDLHLVDTEDGNMLFNLPTQIRNDLGYGGSLSLDYSPDGKYVIGFSRDGVIRMNAKDGGWQNIPLRYTVVSPHIGYAYSPEFTWVDNSTILVPVTNLPEGASEINDNDLRADPNASFTIWRVNLMDAVTQPIQTFTGYTRSVNISSNGNYLAYEKIEKKSSWSGNGMFAALYQPGLKLGGAPPPDLRLADLNTGTILTTLEAVYGLSWSPYSDLYTYSQSGQPVNGINSNPTTFLGQIGADPILLGDFRIAGISPLYIRWLNDKRFVMEDGCELLDVKLSSSP